MGEAVETTVLSSWGCSSQSACGVSLCCARRELLGYGGIHPRNLLCLHPRNWLRDGFLPLLVVSVCISDYSLQLFHLLIGTTTHHACQGCLAICQRKHYFVMWADGGVCDVFVLELLSRRLAGR
jgi:hypothetical protein